MKMIEHNHFICHLILGTFTEYPSSGCFHLRQQIWLSFQLSLLTSSFKQPDIPIFFVQKLKTFVQIFRKHADVF